MSSSPTCSSVQRQRLGQIVVLPQPAVEIRLEIGHAALFVERSGLHVQMRGVHVGDADIGAVIQGLSADHRQKQISVPADEADPVAGVQRLSLRVGHKSVFFGELEAVCQTQALCLAVIQEVLIPPAVCVHIGFFPLREPVVAVGLRIEQGGFLLVHSPLLLFDNTVFPAALQLFGCCRCL